VSNVYITFFGIHVQFDLYKKNENLREQIQYSREYIEDVDYGVQMALKKTNDLEQYTRKSSVRIFGPTTFSRSLLVTSFSNLF
jgi:hypothetical protein